MFPQNDASVDRAMGLLGQQQVDADTRYWLFNYFLELPLNYVDQHRDRIFAPVDVPTRLAIGHRKHCVR